MNPNEVIGAEIYIKEKPEEGTAKVERFMKGMGKQVVELDKELDGERIHFTKNLDIVEEE